MRVLNDFSTSVMRALSEIDPNWRTYHGLIVCGTHSPHDVEQMIDAIRQARELRMPFLGICFGHQLAAIEYARNVLNIKDATSEEFGKGTFVVKKRPEMKIGLHDGESWWSAFDVDPELFHKWIKARNFITVPFHPEYQSSRDNPHPVLVEFLEICRK